MEKDKKNYSLISYLKNHMSSNGQMTLEAWVNQSFHIKRKCDDFSNVYITTNLPSPSMDLPWRMVSIILLFSSLRVGKQIGVWSNLRLEKIFSTLEGRGA
jgi:hypothetical protein